MEEIVNKVANSSLITLNLEEYYEKGDRILYDIKDNLFQGLILREKDFRDFIKDHDFLQYKDKLIAITCSADAIVPTWAYMLLSSKMEPFAKKIVFGNLEDLEKSLYQEALSKINFSEYTDAKVVIKGCGSIPVPTFAYVELTNKLRPFAASIMYGEPCSTVPIYKKAKV
jgi:hypothetical protein